MNFIDLLVFLWALALGVRGKRRGLVLEGLEAASALGGIAVARYAGPAAGRMVAIEAGVAEPVARGVAFVLLALAVASAGYWLAARLSRSVPEEGPWALADGAGGFAFGAAKGIVYSGLVLVLFALLPFRTVSEWTYGSAFCRALFALLPGLYQRLDGWM